MYTIIKKIEKIQKGTKVCYQVRHSLAIDIRRHPGVVTTASTVTRMVCHLLQKSKSGRKKYRIAIFVSSS